ncbi:MAG TPA: bifunctional DNA primase/polymerase [Nitrososphaera sp.]|jgi:hypothetical protein|nr:bifunctional DNA primase/polymerase [Nitrososphaera sp.]
MTTTLDGTPTPDMNKGADFWFYERGVNVIPADTVRKRTFVKWSRLQLHPQDEEEFENLKRVDAFRNGIAIIPGQVWRGEQKGNYLIFIDCDNKKAIEEICTNLKGKTIPLEKLADKFIVEQHRDNPNKCHIFFYSPIPFEKKSSDIVDAKTPPENIPAFEVKGKGSHGIAYVTPSLHQNGHPYEIIGTDKPIPLNPSEAHGIMDRLDAICRKYKLRYLSDSRSSIGVYGSYDDDHYEDTGEPSRLPPRRESNRNLIPMSEIEKDDFVVYEGHNRHEILLRFMESRIKKLRNEKSLNEIWQVCYDKNEKMCRPPLDDREFERQWKDATKFVDRTDKEEQEFFLAPPETRSREEQKQEQEQKSVHAESEPKEQQPKFELTPDLTRELTYEEVAVILSTSIKKDKAAKLITFAAMLLAQTNEDQLNIGYQAESSAGKSYLATEVASYFPPDEVQLIASASPTAFYHDGGKWDDQKKAIIKDLAHKILIFLDQQHFQLLEKLRPMLSKDKKELHYMITDKSQKHGLRTKNVILKGYPSVFFCTAKTDPDEQEKTRMMLLSPSTDKEKLLESLELAAQRNGNRDGFRKQIAEDPMRTWLVKRIYAIRQEGIREIILPDDGIRKVLERFKQEHADLLARHQRDFPRIFSLIKAHALLNCFNREKVKPDTIVATNIDIEAGFKLYKEVESSNELGLSPYIHRIYKEVFEPQLDPVMGLDRKKIRARYLDIFHKSLTGKVEETVIQQLEAAGLIYQEPDPADRRKTLIYPTVSGNISY